MCTNPPHLLRKPHFLRQTFILLLLSEVLPVHQKAHLPIRLRICFFNSARSTPLPTLLEMNGVFSNLPLSSPPTGSKRSAAPMHTTTQISATWMAWFTRAMSFYIPDASKGKAAVLIRPSNPFLTLKSGRKSFIVAAVSGGNISFIK